MVWFGSGEKSAQIKHRLQAKTVQNSSKQICGWNLMWETTGDALLHWRKRYYGLWFQVKNVFVSHKHVDYCLLKMLTDGLEWCGLLWGLYQLFGLSFWRHPFTAEDPLLRQWCRDTFLQIWWRNKLIYILDNLRVSTFSANFHFGVNNSFNLNWDLSKSPELWPLSNII